MALCDNIAILGIGLHMACMKFEPCLLFMAVNLTLFAAMLLVSYLACKHVFSWMPD